MIKRKVTVNDLMQKNYIYCLTEPIGKNFHPEFSPELKPKQMIDHLDLMRPIYKKTASFGHFGRSEDSFTWEKTDKVEALKEDAGI